MESGNEIIHEPLKPMDFYRSTFVGNALVETLNEMVSEGLIPADDAWELLVVANVIMLFASVLSLITSILDKLRCLSPAFHSQKCDIEVWRCI